MDKKKALILDDDRTVASTLGMILSANRYEVRLANSAEDAVDLIAQWCPDVAIVDVLLPGMNGVDFAVMLQSTCPGCCVLLFTALPGVIGSIEAARTQGHIFEILEKPIAPLFMLNKLAAILAAGPNHPPAPPPA